jgi:hypothetical protein
MKITKANKQNYQSSFFSSKFVLIESEKRLRNTWDYVW